MTNKVVPMFMRQFKAKFILVVVFLSVMLLLGLLLISQLVEKNQQLSTEQLPQLLQQQKIQQQLIIVDNLLRQLQTTTVADEISIQHQQLLTHWQRLAVLTKPNNKLFNELSYQHKNQDVNSQRLAQNAARNKQLTIDSKLQLQLVLSALHDVISKKQRQQAGLYQQITEDQLTDRVTAVRAKAHTKLINQLLQLQQLAQRLTQVLQLISELSLQTSSDQFDLLSQITIQSFTALEQYRRDVGKSEDTTLFAQLTMLDDLFFNEQQFIAKWRGQLRLYQGYTDYLRQVELSLKPLLIESGQSQLPVVDATSVDLASTWLTPINKRLLAVFESFSWSQWLVGLAILFTLAMLGMVLLLLLAKRKIEGFHLANLQLIDNSLNKHVKVEPSYREQQALLDILQAVTQPEFSAQDYQLLKERANQQAALLAQWQQVATWSFSQSWQREAESLNRVLGLIAKPEQATEKSLASWRRYFPTAAVQQMVSTARAVKLTNQPALMAVATLTGHTVLLSIHYQRGEWFGTLANYQHVDNLRQEIHQLEQQHKHKLQHNARQSLQLNRQLQQLVLQAMLQLQQNSLAAHTDESLARSIPLYRKLKRMDEVLAIARTFDSARQLVLTNVELEALIQSVVLNMQHEANRQRSKLVLAYDSSILNMVTIDAYQIEQLLTYVSQLVLANHFNATLCLNITLHDKRPGQQVVRFSFQLAVAEGQVVLPKVLEQLNQPMSASSNPITDYLHNSLQLLNGQGIQLSSSELGYQLQFNLPLALSEQAAVNLPDAEFKQLRVVLISQDKRLKQELTRQFKSWHLAFDTLADASQFNQQYALTNLTNKHLDLVLLANDSLALGLTGITQHIASLPSQYQPKLLVLQEQKPANLLRFGLYQQCQSPLFTQPLLGHIKRLIADQCMSNLLLTAEQCQRHQYSMTQVELLLAVRAPEPHQVLANLLQFLGFQVHVTSNEQAMLQQWQSGRYLLLVTEFKVAAELPFTVANNVARAIFMLTELVAEPNKSQHSRVTVARLAKVTDLPALTQQLFAWLAPLIKPERVEQAQQTARTLHSRSTPMQQSVKESPQDAPYQPILGSPDVKAELDEVLNLQQFAWHQGSVELAAIMLDDYLENIEQALQEMQQHIAAKQYHNALLISERLLTIAKILAAPKLQHSVSALRQALSSEQAAPIQSCVTELEQQLQAVVLFAETV